MERTYRFQQSALKDAVDVGSAKKIFTLRLDQLGPYNAQYSRNGRHLLLGGKMGHLAVCDWVDGKVTCEVQVRDVCMCM
jgi:U3 small nucleolar RNA-associated protein 7